VVHRAGNADVVVGDEDEAVADIGVSGELGDLLDQALAGMVGRVSLSGEDELHGSISVEQKCTQPIDLVQQEVRSLVRGEATGEPDCEDVRIEEVMPKPIAHEVYEFLAADVTHGPDVGLVDVANMGPGVGAG
jgi:hypothetical protein